MPLEPSRELPLDAWMPCYPAPTMHLGLEPDGLHVTTIPTGGGYAVRYPILKARVARESRSGFVIGRSQATSFSAP
jgi:hypothetical protein